MRGRGRRRVERLATGAALRFVMKNGVMHKGSPFAEQSLER